MIFCHLEATEEVDSLEKLDFDQDQYPQLPDNIGALNLHCQKAILWQYMGATRCKYYSDYTVLFQLY